MNILVIGAGYVGLTSAVGLAELGHAVVGQDIDAERVRLLAMGTSPIFEPDMEAALRAGLAAGRLRFTVDPAPSPDTDIAVVCVPTLPGEDGLLSTDRVDSVVARLLHQLPSGAVIVVRSTLPLHEPERLAGLRAGGAAIGGADGGSPAIVINPEFMREGRALADFRRPSRVVVGALAPSDLPAARLVAGLYEPLGAPVIVRDATSVVLMKLASNVFLGLKVAFADELARLADAIGADVDAVADGVGLDPRIGRSFLDAGPGFGGSCLPEQAAAIAVEAEGRSVVAPLLGSVATSNRRHQDAVAAAVGRLIPSGPRGARIALLGLAFKADTDDVRHSPALELAGRLRAAGAEVVGFDPVAAAAALQADPDLVTAPTIEAALDGADAVVVATDWPMFAELDWATLAHRMRGDLLYDTRRRIPGQVVRAAGLRYVALGQPEVRSETGVRPGTGVRPETGASPR